MRTSTIWHVALISCLAVAPTMTPSGAIAEATARAQEPPKTEVIARGVAPDDKVLPRARTTTADDGAVPSPAPIESDAPLPPKARPDDELVPAVTIRTEGGTRIEEYRQNGRLVMVRVVPKVGIPYSFLDTDGNGRLEGEPGSLTRGGVQPVFYTLYEWE